MQMKTILQKKKLRVLFWGILLLFLVMQAYPVVWLVTSSFKPNLQIASEPFALPVGLTLENYQNVILKSNIFTYIKNSTIVSGISLLAIVIFSSMASFAISKMIFRGSKRIFEYFLIGLTIPYAVTLIPLYIMYSKVGFIDTYLSVIFPLVAFQLPVSVLLFTNFYRFIPNAIIEAAIIDGTSIWGIYFKIITPLSVNTIVTVLAMNFITVWNDYTFSLVFLNSNSMKTISVGLQDFIGARGLTDWGATFASICITTLPTLALYFILNKKITSGMTLGAVKS